MVRRGRRGYQTQAQKEGRSAGQRARRQLREEKRRLRDANLYRIAVRTSVIPKSRRNNETLAAYGVYHDENENEWVLTGMSIRRDEEIPVSDRQGATKTEVRERYVVVPVEGVLNPRDGLEVGRFDRKKDAMNEISADSSTKISQGSYVVRRNNCGRSMKTYKVDRDRYRNWSRSRAVSRVRSN